MAEHFSFFDAVLQEDGVTYDREYDAEEFTDYFKTLVTTGVMKGAGNMLAVSANGSNMVTKIDTGIAFIEGKYYKNDSFKELTHDTETLGNSRIDRIVVRIDLSTEARYVKSFIKKGVPSTSPVAPTLTQTANLYEISLAQVKIVGGQTFIAVNAVADERGKDAICPWAGSNLLPNYGEAEFEDLVKRFNGRDLVEADVTDLNDLKDPGLYSFNDPNMLNRVPGGFWKDPVTQEYVGDIVVVGKNALNGSVTQTTYKILNGNTRRVTIYIRAFSYGVWGEWGQSIDDLSLQPGYKVVYVNFLTGNDQNNGATKETAFKTINAAIRAAFRLNRLDVVIAGGAGQTHNYQVQIFNSYGSTVYIKSDGVTPKPVVSGFSIGPVDRFIMQDIDFQSQLNIENCPDFYIKNCLKTISNGSTVCAVKRSRGIFDSTLFSNGYGGESAGLHVLDNSDVYLYYAQGGGNAIGILCDGSFIRKGAGTSITGSVATKLLNGGQVV